MWNPVNFPNPVSIRSYRISNLFTGFHFFHCWVLFRVFASMWILLENWSYRWTNKLPVRSIASISTVLKRISSMTAIGKSRIKFSLNAISAVCLFSNCECISRSSHMNRKLSLSTLMLYTAKENKIDIFIKTSSCFDIKVA